MHNSINRGHNFDAVNFSKYMINNDYQDLEMAIKDCKIE